MRPTSAQPTCRRTRIRPSPANPLAGANALPTNFYRPYLGYGAINRRMTVGYNNFHSLQTRGTGGSVTVSSSRSITP